MSHLLPIPQDHSWSNERKTVTVSAGHQWQRDNGWEWTTQWGFAYPLGVSLGFSKSENLTTICTMIRVTAKLKDNKVSVSAKEYVEK